MSDVDEQIPISDVPVDSNLPTSTGKSQSTPSTDSKIQSSNKSSQQSTTPGTPAIADDTDLIEKEWVEKAKQILADNKDNPHVLNKELNRVKADYIKKRYNKDLKTTND